MLRAAALAIHGLEWLAAFEISASLSSWLGVELAAIEA
jgi:hypothetical protein